MKDTRRQILEKNFEAIHKHGFQGLRTDQVIKELGITKGAFYHYFSGKQELGYCVVDEIIAPQYLDHWNQLYSYVGHPIEGIIERLMALRREMPGENIQLGCPLNNLIQEMTPLDEGFRQKLNRIARGMHLAIQDALIRGQKARLVDPDADPEKVAFFVLSTLEGSFSIAKSFQNRRPFDASIDLLINHLRTFKNNR
ncbi:MAG: TetR/AcrR family transcriptional regulator [Lewinellaceae bacterium]|nr:TetR/AcrR family transcriptional regulator [Phaeodactylibacter sp.]MCB0611718.1 TetR/AcrR family transcriptional regulator [Phaeodactylibacter sp.]MCB9347664.1 TetR/AcrR family transcriptional regulator [Lewinellaceae bacterium]